MSTLSEFLMTDGTGKEIAGAIQQVANAITGERGGLIYGFHIDHSESDPDAKVTYLKDAIGMTPAHMDYDSGVFDYGSWEDAFFMPRPCMLKSDGTVGYYLSPNNYAKKEDGTTNSDVASTSYDGNAMMEWGRNGKKIWMKIVPSNDRKSVSIYIADHKADEGFHDWAFHNSNGESVDHFYTAIYNGSVVSSKMRSLSGQQVSKSLQASAEVTDAQANGATMWDIEKKADIDLINALLVLMAKTTDTQTAYGKGLCTGGTEAINDAFRTGVHNDKGLFYGTNSDAIASGSYGNAVKVFGMENWWGFQWRRYLGHIMVNGVQKLKLTYGKEDGTGCTGFNLTGADYLTEGVTPTGTSGGYIDEMNYSENGMLPKNASGDSTHHYCDGLWFNNAITSVPFRGGHSCNGARCGAFCVDLHTSASTADWSVGAALSCKPLA